MTGIWSDSLKQFSMIIVKNSFGGFKGDGFPFGHGEVMRRGDIEGFLNAKVSGSAPEETLKAGIRYQAQE